MGLTQLSTDDDAVSPVIGVILMVAITVILAAVIASFVLNLGGSTNQTTPEVSWEFDYEPGSTDTNFPDNLGTDGSLAVTHDGGDTIDVSRLSMTTDSGDSVDFDNLFGLSISEVSAGTTVNTQVGSATTVNIVWTSPDGETSSILATYEGPDA